MGEAFRRGILSGPQVTQPHLPVPMWTGDRQVIQAAEVLVAQLVTS